MTGSLKQTLSSLSAAILLTMSFGCGNDAADVDPEDRLCRGNSGFAARITGTFEPVEMCVSDENTLTTFIPESQGIGSRYITLAAYSTDSLQIEIEISFFVHSTTPIVLQPTSNRSLADAEPGAALFVYRETKTGDYQYESGAVSGGFTLTLSDENVAAATFSSLQIELDDVASGDESVATRAISEGYLLVTSSP